MGYYPKIYTSGAAVEALKKPDKPKVVSSVSEVKEVEKAASKIASKTPELPNLILIGVPCYRTILVRTVWSIIDTLRKYPDTTDIAFQNGVFVHENQNALVELAKEKKASHIFFIEHDIVFPPDTLERLLELDKDVACAPYSGRKLPREPLVYQKGQDEQLYMMSYDMWPEKPFRAYGVPTGCTLIKMSVFDKLKKPYFFFEHTDDGKMKMSQDIYFSKKVNEAGMECFCDPTINIVHIGDHDY